MTIVVGHAADPRLDDYRSLNDQAYRRRYEGEELFVVEGYVGIDRLIESGHSVRSVLLAPSRVERFSSHLDGLAARGTPVYVADRDVIAEVVGFDLHRGVVACARRRPLRGVGEVLDGARRVAVLEGLNDNENLGAIARAAKAFRFDGLLLDPTCTDPYSRRTVRVSMGEVLNLPIARPSPDQWPGVLSDVRLAGFEVWAMTPAPTADDLWSVPIPDRVAVLLGAEGPGLTRSALAAADRHVRIPINSAVDSLNVGQAAAIAFAAVTRT
ncbi:MAG TPA: RNA methyltransferase [Ilumatobacteraceae bacterium]|nr:RNA methyltransferase [Ilumatobacteraceae bacterium]